MMTLNDSVIKWAIREFFYLLNKHPDQTSEYIHFMLFIEDLLKLPYSEEELPITEIMAVLKKRKPNIFHLMRNQKRNMLLLFLTDVSMNEKDAMLRLKKIVKGQKEDLIYRSRNLEASPQMLM